MFSGFRESAVGVSRYLRIITVSLSSRVSEPLKVQVRNYGSPRYEGRHLLGCLERLFITVMWVVPR